MARRVAAFLDEAQRSLDLALYDVRLPDEPGDIVGGALRAAAARGVAVRIAYNADHDERVFPPPPRTKPELLEALPFPTIGIPGIPDLMHHKYAVRDGRVKGPGANSIGYAELAGRLNGTVATPKLSNAEAWVERGKPAKKEARAAPSRASCDWRRRGYGRSVSWLQVFRLFICSLAASSRNYS